MGGELGEQQKEIIFMQGTRSYFEGESSWDNNEDEIYRKVTDKIADFFNIKNVCFLLGAGASCGAIPVMKGLYECVKEEINKDDELKGFFLGIDASSDGNLEKILSTLYSGSAYYKGSGHRDDSECKLCGELIRKIEYVIFKKLNVDFTSPNKETQEVLETYKTFYRKIALRNKDLSRICVFTTNNDLFNEKALDSLNIHYVDGFSGGLTRYFNPAMFNYTFSKRMDTGIDKYEPVENMVYLYKLHGSINWKTIDNNTSNYFSIVEEPEPHEEGTVLIYPTPQKQEHSIGTPYVDLFREFQHKMLEPNTVLFVIGYGFSDEHVNDVIYRALATNTTFSIVIINKIEDKPICKIDDARIFFLYGKVAGQDGQYEKIHYFKHIAYKLLPDLSLSAQEETNLDEVIKALKSYRR